MQELCVARRFMIRIRLIRCADQPATSGNGLKRSLLTVDTGNRLRDISLVSEQLAEHPVRQCVNDRFLAVIDVTMLEDEVHRFQLFVA